MYDTADCGQRLPADPQAWQSRGQVEAASQPGPCPVSKRLTVPAGRVTISRGLHSFCSISSMCPPAPLASFQILTDLSNRLKSSCAECRLKALQSHYIIKSCTLVHLALALVGKDPSAQCETECAPSM